MPGIPNRGTGLYTSADVDGANGSGLTVPSSAALSITGAISFIARIAPDDWTSGIVQGIISKTTTTGNQRSYRWVLSTTGVPLFLWSVDGSASATAQATAPYAFTDGQAAWIGCTVDTVGGAVKFWNGGTAATPTWVQHGSTVSTAFTASFASTSLLALGVGYILTGTDLREVLNGKLYQAAIYSGVGANTAPGQGTRVFEVNGVFGPGTTFTAATGHAITKVGGVSYTDLSQSVLDATAVGLTRLVGPCVWMPNASANSVSASVTIEAASNRIMRAELSRNATDANSRIGNAGPIAANVFANGSVQGVVQLSDASFLTTTVTAAGATASYTVDGWFQISSEWTQATKTLAVKLRSPGLPLADDTGWTQVGTVTSALNSGAAASSYTWNQNTNPNVAYRGMYASGAVRASALNITPHDLGRALPGASSFLVTSGQTATVARTTTGPASTIVPDGVEVYLNHDPATATNLLSVPNTGAGAFNLAANEDAILGWVGVLGNIPTPATIIAGMGIATDTSQMNIYNGSATMPVRGAFNSTGGSLATVAPGQPTVATYAPVAVLMVLDRTAVTIRVSVYSAMGALLASTTASTAAHTTVVNTAVFQVIKSLPGWTSGFLWRKGVGIAPSTTTQAVLARQLLTTTYRPARATTSPALPVAPHVYGDRWKSSTTGAIQFYNGSAWVLI